MTVLKPYNLILSKELRRKKILPPRAQKKAKQNYAVGGRKGVGGKEKKAKMVTKKEWILFLRFIT